GTDIFACPIGNCLSLANQKLFMFLKIIGHQVKGFFRKMYRLGISSNWQSHQTKNQAAVSGGYFGRNRLSTKDPAANSGWWERIQEASNQTTSGHGGIGHDFIQHTGLN